MSSVTSSSRSAGTCHANSSPPRRASTSIGTCTVTPSSTAPGSNRYVRGSSTSPVSQASGRSAPAVSSVRNSSSRVNVSRSGRPVPLLLPPCVEMPCGHDVGRYACVVQREDRPDRRRAGHAFARDPRAPPPLPRSRALSRKKWWRVCHSPSTSACWMNSSRASGGSICP